MQDLPQASRQNNSTAESQSPQMDRLDAKPEFAISEDLSDAGDDREPDNTEADRAAAAATECTIGEDCSSNSSVQDVESHHASQSPTPDDDHGQCTPHASLDMNDSPPRSQASLDRPVSNGDPEYSSHDMSSTPSSKFVYGQWSHLGYSTSTPTSQSVDGVTIVTPSADATSKKVGQYVLGLTIGEGSYGKVRLATHLISKQQVAVKVVTKKSLVLRETARRHFRREALLLQQVHHPNIVRLYEAMETASCYYLVFELARGTSILSVLALRSSLDEQETRHVMRQVVSAVDHLHRTGIVHRDLKLDNLLVDEQYTVKLVDFGLSSVCHDSDQQLTTQCGSPVYAAPEVFAGRKYGKPVDIWSLGVCLFAMLMGRLPFLPESATSLSQLYSLILKGCSPPGQVSPSCQDLIRRMLELQEGRRITIEETLTHHWLEEPGGQPIRRFPVVPRRPPACSINQQLVKYICTMSRFSESDVTNSVMERKLSAAGATYHILHDAIEAGRLSVSFPRESSSSAKGRLPRKSSGSPTKAEKCYLPSASRASSVASDTTSQRSISSVTSREYGSRPESYKSYILVLKRSRQKLGRPEQHQGNTDYILVGRSPGHVSTTDGPQAAISARMSFPLTFPPISSMASWPDNKHFPRHSQGRTRYYRELQQVAQLDVRGVPASSIRQSSPTHITHHRISALAPAYYPLSVTTPPPAPPNSSLGDRSGQQWLLEDECEGLGISHLSDNDGQGCYSESPNRPHMGHFISPPARQQRAPPRPTLASLRDPYGKDTWSKSTRPRDHRTARHEPKLTPEAARDRKVVWDVTVRGGERGKAARVYNKMKESLEGEGHSTSNFQMEDHEKDVLYGMTHDSSPRPHMADSQHGMMRESPNGGLSSLDHSPHRSLVPARAYRPESQAQDKDDYLTPVTRVTIKTIARRH